MVHRALAITGRTLITAGILMLGFVSYQLWGTGIYADRQQGNLRDQFTKMLHRTATTPTTAVTPTTTPIPTTTTTQAIPLPPPPGDAVAQLRINKIGLDTIVVNGIARDDLRNGPGHYPSSTLPGQKGNSAIAGHRTTYGAPFGDLDELTVGDMITVRTPQGTFAYSVYEKLVVDPSNGSVLEDDPTRAATLTLTTCTPKYSAEQRLVVKGELSIDQTPLPAPPPPSGTGSTPVVTNLGLSGDSGSKLPTVLAGTVTAIIGLLWWLLFHWRPRMFTWLVGAVPFAVSLFFFYVFLERLLPANY